MLEEPVEIDEVLSTFDAPTRRAIQENLVEFGNALAGRGPALNSALGQAATGAALPRAGDGQPLGARHRARALHQRQRRGGCRGGAGGRGPGRAVRQPRYDLHRAGTGRPPVHPGDDLRDTADLRRRRARAADDPAVPRPQRRAVHRSSSRGSRRSPATPRRSPTRSRPGRRSCATRRGSTASWSRPRRRCSPSTTTRVVRDGLARLRQTMDIAGPALRFITPAQTVCNYGSAVPGQLRRGDRRGRRGHASGSGSRSSSRPTGPNNEGGVASAPANGGGNFANFLHFNPYPNTAAPGPDEGVRGRQRALRRWPAGDRQRARQPGHGDRGSARRRRVRGGGGVRRPFAKRESRRCATRPSRCPTSAIWGRNYRGPAPWVFGLVICRAARDRRLSRVRQGAAVRRQGLRADGDVRERRHPARDLSRSDRGRQRRRGDRGRSRRRGGQGHLHRRR